MQRLVRVARILGFSLRFMRKEFYADCRKLIKTDESDRLGESRALERGPRMVFEYAHRRNPAASSHEFAAFERAVLDYQSRGDAAFLVAIRFYDVAGRWKHGVAAKLLHFCDE